MVQPVTNAVTTRHGGVTEQRLKILTAKYSKYANSESRKGRISSFEIKIRIRIKKPKKHQIDM
jgi:hypothetical protein